MARNLIQKPVNIVPPLSLDDYAAFGVLPEPHIFSINKFGQNANVGTSFVTVWSQGGLYTYIPTATQLKVSSSSTLDVSPATVRIFGLNTAYEMIEEDVILTGQTEKLTNEEFLRVFRMKMIDKAAGQVTNVGDIYAGDGVVASGIPATVYSKVDATDGFTYQSFYTVPSTHKALLKSFISTTSANEITSELWVRTLDGPFLKQDKGVFNNIFQDTINPGLYVPPSTDIEVRAKANTGAANVVTASFRLLLVPRAL